MSSRGRGRGSGRHRGGDSGRDEKYKRGRNYERVDDDRYEGGNGGSRSKSDQGGSRGRGRRGGGHPPGLKGKEIGLYYAKISKEKAKNKTGHDIGFQNTLEIDLKDEHQTEIATLLERLSSDKEKPVAKTSSSINPFWNKYYENLQGNFASNISTDIPLNNGEVLERNPQLDTTLQEELRLKFENEHFKRMQTFRKKLPADKAKSDILNLVEKNQVVVISGETGCGKTTQIPQFILENCILTGNGSVCNILCSQPRRISATSVAERIADERAEKVGGKSIGYSIRLENRLPSRRGGTITFCTTGVILQYLKDDPLLKVVSHVIVDEVHERDILTDFLLAILKSLVLKRPDLKVIVMSATLNSQMFSSYFHDCPSLNIPGLTFPVDEYYLEDIIEKTRFSFPTSSDDSQSGSYPPKRMHHNAVSEMKKKVDEYNQVMRFHLIKLEKEKTYSSATIKELRKLESETLNLDLIQALLEYICETDRENGAILIFVPGWDEISKLRTQLEASRRFPYDRFLIIPLHSLMPTINQREVFNRPPHGKRKIIISTNIAETSVTIDDVVFVIDSGKIKITNFNLKINLETLDTEWVSHANAKQRKGRAGRVQKGVCYHLFSRGRLAHLEEFKPPEVLRKRLEETVLQIKMLKLGEAERFFNLLPDSPCSTAIQLAITRLNQLHALDGMENLTPLGFHLAHLPMDPQTGKMILMGAIFSCVDPVFSIAASLSFKDPFYTPLGKEKHVDYIRRELSEDTKSDHFAIVRAMEGYERALQRNNVHDYCYKNFLSQNTLKLLRDLKTHFAGYLHDMKFLSSNDIKSPSANINSSNIALIKAIACAGLYPNVAYVTFRSKSRGFPVVRTLEDGSVNIHPKSVNANVTNFESPFLIYHEKMKTKAINLFDTTMISAFPLIFFGGKIDFLSTKDFSSMGVDSLTRFKCSQQVYELVEGLRNQLDRLFDQRICNPGPTSWNESSNEGKLLRTILKVITSEYRCVVDGYDISSSDGSDSDY